MKREMPLQREFISIDVKPGGAMESQSGLQMLRPRIQGVLVSPANPVKTACVILHPVSNFMAHYLLEPLAARGFACLGLNTRYVNNDTMLQVERAVQDLGAGVRMLRERGYERIFLLGNSGGAALAALYQAEAEAFTLRTLVDGSPSGLVAEDFGRADGIVLFGAHEGRSLLFEKWIDPSLPDERDPDTADAEIDMFNPENGPAYSAEFLARYRARQIERRDRIEHWVDERLKRLASEPGRPQDEAFVIHRTLADPRCLDLGIDANDRPVGTIWGDAKTVNLAPNCVGRYTSLRAFLSQWSSRSRMNGPACLARTSVRVLHFTYTADASTFPSTRDLWMKAGNGRIANVDVVGANHYLSGQPDLVPKVADTIADWVLH
jgi:pimeloyl-ACP methyl ester carboxylesterase